MHYVDEGRRRPGTAPPRRADLVVPLPGARDPAPGTRARASSPPTSTASAAPTSRRDQAGILVRPPRGVDPRCSSRRSTCAGSPSSSRTGAARSGCASPARRRTGSTASSCSIQRSAPAACPGRGLAPLPRAHASRRHRERAAVAPGADLLGATPWTRTCSRRTTGPTRTAASKAGVVAFPEHVPAEPEHRSAEDARGARRPRALGEAGARSLLGLGSDLLDRSPPSTWPHASPAQARPRSSPAPGTSCRRRRARRSRSASSASSRSSQGRRCVALPGEASLPRHTDVQVSPEWRSASRSPSPERSRAASSWASIRSS